MTETQNNPFSTWYEAAKKFLWPHTLIPLAIMVLLDYFKLLAQLAQIVLCCYVMIQLFVFVVGLWGGMMLRINKDSMWKGVLGYNAAKIAPTLKLGFEAVDWLLANPEEDKAEKERLKREAKEEADRIKNNPPPDEEDDDDGSFSDDDDTP